MLPVTTDLRDDCLVITVDHPPVNALSHAVRAGLVEALGATRYAVMSTASSSDSPCRFSKCLDWYTGYQKPSTA